MINNTTIETREICSRQEQSTGLTGKTEYGRGLMTGAWVWNRMPPVGGEEITADPRSATARTRRSAGRRMEKALEYMLQHVDQPLQMAVISKLTGVSESTFYYLFKLATGYTPNDLFTRVRMQHAGGLLRETDLSVKEVAAALGYDDPFYFSRIFKSVHGVPPREYRNNKQTPLNEEAGQRSP